MTSLTLSTNHELDPKSQIESINCLLEDIEFHEPLPAKFSFRQKLYANRAWLWTVGALIFAVATVVAGILEAGPDRLDPSWSYEALLGSMGLAAVGFVNVCIHLDSQGFDRQFQLNKWLQKKGDLRAKLQLSLQNPHMVPQYSVKTYRYLDRVEIKLNKQSGQYLYEISKEVISGQELEDLDKALTLKEKLEKEAKRLNYQARAEYLETNWNSWEELLLPYDPVAQQAKELYQVLEARA